MITNYKFYITGFIKQTPLMPPQRTVHLPAYKDKTIYRQADCGNFGDISAHCAASVADALAVHIPHHDNIVSLQK